MEFALSKHATDTLRERGISLDWLAQTLDDPTRTTIHPNDPQLTHALRAIPDFDNRVLRVIYNHTRQPVLVVTAYFDRTMKGML